MRDAYPETAGSDLSLRSHRDPAVRRMLASYNTPVFKELLLHKAMAHLLGLLEKKEERDYALISIGHTATAVGADMKPFLESVMSHIKARLREMAGLRACLGQVARSIPLLLGVVQGTPYSRLGVPSVGTGVRRGESTGPNGTSGTTVNQGYGYAGAGAGVPPSKELLTLLLNTLGTFDFSGHTLTEFVQTNALPYVEDDSPELDLGNHGFGSNSHRSADLCRCSACDVRL
ncbi:hypothetical protein DFH06DRAFT_1246361 [Mycena polygramma]|nr:hypothetical protein DFH06DRAFT_1246361 [Mycena polygramma]